MRYDIKTLHNGKAWIADKILRKAQNLSEDLVLVHEGKKMVIENERIKKTNTTLFEPHPHNPQKDKFGGEDYNLYGVHFIAE